MEPTQDQRAVRRPYRQSALRRTDLAADPLDQFAGWLQAALDEEAIDATAMTLATASPQGAPSARIVLLKHFDAQGYCWYTDCRSRKGAELAANPQAALLFHWRDFERQARIAGRVEKLPAAQSDVYFQSRPEASRFAAAASVQSAPVANRDALQRQVERLRRRHPDGAVPRPAPWGGYRLRPAEYEFWQGREGRLHDRFRYVRAADGAWTVQRLQP